MKKLIEHLFALLSAWERRTDAEFAELDQFEQQAITEFINAITY